MKINISIDDISPHPQSSTKVLKQCRRIINSIPDVKFTLFIPTAYKRLNQFAYPLNSYPDFCEEIRNLPKENFEVGYHGITHGTKDSNNDEFKHMPEENVYKYLVQMMDQMSYVGIEARPLFRPSAFRLNANVARIAQDNFGMTLALHPDIPILGKEKRVDKSKIVYCTANPPFKELELKEPYTEIVYHACEWDKSYLDDTKTLELLDFLQKNRHPIDDSFYFMEDLLDG